MQTTAKTLSDVPAINRFLSYCRVRTVPSKTVMIHAGDLPDVLYYIVDGSVEVMIEDEDGNEMVLAYLNKGQFFGDAIPADRKREPGTGIRTCDATRDETGPNEPQAW
jgi:CRP/FNR family cyclic AMP-dependent transcriptional regulator